MTAIAMPKPVTRFVETSCAKNIQQALAIASSTPFVVAITGKPGTGKTCAVRHYCESYRSFYCAVTTPHKSSRGFLKLMCEAFGVGFRAKINPNTYQMHDDLYHRVRNLERTVSTPAGWVEQTPMLIVDETQVLHHEALFDLLKLQEDTKISVILISNHERLAQTKAHSVVEYSAITSRIDMRVATSKPTEDDLKAVCVEHNVDFKAIDPLVQIGHQETLRQFVRLVERARMVCGASGPVKLAHIHAAVSSIYSTKEAAKILSRGKRVA